jgi:hypothetical protein
MKALHLTLAAALLGPGASAQLDVAICAAADTSSTTCNFLDVQAKLMGTGQFNSVGIINVTTTGGGIPTLLQLQAYDAVICWTNQTPSDNNLWGDTLADYVDQGGGVVVAVFANSTTTVGRNIGGRWQLGYEVIKDQSGNTTGNASLGNIVLPAHPVMSGVSTFTGGNSMFRPNGTALEVGSFTIAEWSDGRILAAQGLNPRRVDIGFYPPSSDCVAAYWSTASDGARLMANALSFVAGSGSSCTPPVNYCTPSTTTNGCTPTLSATGTASVSASSGFVLDCTSVEGQKAGLIFYGVSGRNSVPWAVGSTSFFCVKTPTQRLPSQSSGGTAGACDGVLSNDLAAYLSANPSSLGMPFGAGDTVQVQAWFRDPPATKTTNLSDGLEFVWCP